MKPRTQARMTGTIADKALTKLHARAVVVLTVRDGEDGKPVVTPMWAGSTKDGVAAVLRTAMELQKLAREYEAARA